QPGPAEQVVDHHPDDGGGTEQIQVAVAHRETVASRDHSRDGRAARQNRPAGLPLRDEVSVSPVRLCDAPPPQRAAKPQLKVISVRPSTDPVRAVVWITE